MKDGQIPGFIGKENPAGAVYRNGNLIVLGRYKDIPTFVTSINSRGDAVGYALGKSVYNALPVEYHNGAFVVLPQVPNCASGAAADTINDRGDIYGTCSERGELNSMQIARYKPGTPTLINGPFNGRGDWSIVNSSGMFVYSGYFFANEGHQAARGVGTTALAVLSSRIPWSTAAWINDAGTVVGSLSYNKTAFRPLRAYIAPKRGPVTVLPLLPKASAMSPAGINNSGEIVGGWDNGLFLYKNGRLYDISKSISPAGTYNPTGGLSDSGSFASFAPQTRQGYIIEPVRGND
jgi:hypothetical protein